MRWLHAFGGMIALGGSYLACGVDRVEDDGEFDNTGGEGGSAPDVTKVCEDQCIPTRPAGEADYRAVRSCLLCSACFTVCKAEGVGVNTCSNMEEPANGCSAASATCAECVQGACALVQDPATTLHTGVCAPQGDVCSNNVACVGITNCVNTCVAMTPQM